jgi:hypothetical protein
MISAQGKGVSTGIAFGRIFWLDRTTKAAEKKNA